VEIGFGTGLNAPYYPAEVTKIFAVEPSKVCMRLAQPRITRTPVAVELAGLNGERLDLPSARSISLFHRAAYTDRRVPDATGHWIEEIISARFPR